MVGDVNIYMNDLDDSQTAEIEIMIAEPKRYKHLHFKFSICVMSFSGLLMVKYCVMSFPICYIFQVSNPPLTVVGQNHK